MGDEEVVTCTNGPNTLVTSRKPDDLPAFCATLLDEIARATSRSAALCAAESWTLMRARPSGTTG
jgi:hypothetical protein